jgi:urease accessory protein
METGDHLDPRLLRVSAVLGNMTDGAWSARLRQSRIDVLRLDAAEAQRSRLRKQTAAGIDIAIGLERGAQLRDGDVLSWDKPGQVAVVVRVELPDVMVVDLSALLAGPAETLLAQSVEVGHALGNQHWPALVKGARIYLPVTVAPDVMMTVLQTHDIKGIICHVAAGAEVLADLAPREARLLFASHAGHAHLPDWPASGEAG